MVLAVYNFTSNLLHNEDEISRTVYKIQSVKHYPVHEKYSRHFLSFSFFTELDKIQKMRIQSKKTKNSFSGSSLSISLFPKSAKSVEFG